MNAFSSQGEKLMKVATVTLLILMASVAVPNQSEGSPESVSGNLTFTYPEKWKKLDTDEYFIFIKQDAFKQYIMVRQRHVDKPYKHTDKLIRRGMSPWEVIDVIVAAFTSDPSVLDFKMVENGQVTVNGYEGFRITCTYGTKEVPKFKLINYGFLVGDWLYDFRYNAAEGCESQEDLETFQKVLKSLKIQ